MIQFDLWFLSMWMFSLLFGENVLWHTLQEILFKVITSYRQISRLSFWHFMESMSYDMKVIKFREIFQCDFKALFFMEMLRAIFTGRITSFPMFIMVKGFGIVFFFILDALFSVIFYTLFFATFSSSSLFLTLSSFSFSMFSSCSLFLTLSSFSFSTFSSSLFLALSSS